MILSCLTSLLMITFASIAMNYPEKRIGIDVFSTQTQGDTIIELVLDCHRILSHHRTYTVIVGCRQPNAETGLRSECSC